MGWESFSSPCCRRTITFIEEWDCGMAVTHHTLCGWNGCRGGGQKSTRETVIQWRLQAMKSFKLSLPCSIMGNVRSLANKLHGVREAWCASLSHGLTRIFQMTMHLWKASILFGPTWTSGKAGRRGACPLLPLHDVPDTHHRSLLGGLCGQVYWFPLQSLKHAEHIYG